MAGIAISSSLFADAADKLKKKRKEAFMILCKQALQKNIGSQVAKNVLKLLFLEIRYIRMEEHFYNDNGTEEMRM